ncbi:hypothetical protein P1X15_31620 [Runella sp. MFBS21]|uniref:hypothetical protein n=1 Tax=Runella sp. MFBS21 TaxID=3034018 RepID=UPI0023F77B3B|nr:hypothetical protein [Runella sp. MFBS21]MDF7822206.1 hypothetical protein [Runella sp. MFBS21]
MGTSASGIIIKCDSTKFSIEEVSRYFFGDGEKTDCSDDTRKRNYITFTKYKDEFHISNSDFTNLFFEQNPIALQKLNTFFNTPVLAFAFNWFESGGTFGYAIIQNGIVRRIYRTLSYVKFESFGEPIKQEVEWLCGDSFINILKDEEYYPPDYPLTRKTYINISTNEKADDYYLPELLLPSVMQEYLGYDVYTSNIELELIESGAYRIAPWNNWGNDIYKAKYWDEWE